MPLRSSRILTAFVVTAFTAPAWPQSFHHAPPSNDAPLLPSISAMLFGPSQGQPTRGLWPRAMAPTAQPVSPTPPPLVSQAAAPPPAPFSPDPNARPIGPAAPATTQWARIAEPAAAAPPSSSLVRRESPPHAVGMSPAPSVATAYVPPAPAPAALPPAPPAQPPAPVVVRPATATAARSLAAERVAAGNPAEAEAILVEATTRFADNADLTVALARLRESREDWIGAAAAYSTVMRLRPEEATWKVRRAECLYHAGDFKAAVADYEAASVDPEALSLGEYARFGDAALRTGDPALAEAAFTALSRTAEEPIARVELLRGMAALKQGETKRARNILLRANARWPRDPALTDALRLAAAMHYGDSAVMTSEGSAAAPTDIVTTSAEVGADDLVGEVSQSSGWRPATTTAEASSGWKRVGSTDESLPASEPEPIP